MIDYKLADAETHGPELRNIDCVTPGLAVGSDAGLTRRWRGGGALEHRACTVGASIDRDARGPSRCIAIFWQKQ